MLGNLVAREASKTQAHNQTTSACPALIKQCVQHHLAQPDMSSKAQAPSTQSTDLPQPLYLQRAAASLLQLGSRAFWLCWGYPSRKGCSHWTLPTFQGQLTALHQSCQALRPDGQQQIGARQRPEGAHCRLPQLQPSLVLPPR